MDWGMENRLNRIIKTDGHCIFLPIDHGYFQGPTRKLEKPGETIRDLIQFADGLFVTRGVLRAAIDPEKSPPLILRQFSNADYVLARRQRIQNRFNPGKEGNHEDQERFYADVSEGKGL